MIWWQLGLAVIIPIGRARSPASWWQEVGAGLKTRWALFSRCAVLVIGRWSQGVQTQQWVLTAAVIVVPLIVAVVVTLWSLEQVRYRPKKRRPARTAARATSDPDGLGHETPERGE